MSRISTSDEYQLPEGTKIAHQNETKSDVSVIVEVPDPTIPANTKNVSAMAAKMNPSRSEPEMKVGFDTASTTNPWESPCPHGNASIDELKMMKLKNYKQCIIRGLPSHATEKLLRSDQWYGQYKEINNIQMDNDESNAIHPSHGMTAIITFDNEISGKDAFKLTNDRNFGNYNNYKMIFAEFGEQLYCHKFLAKIQCTLPDCRYKHEWIDDINDDIIPDKMDQLKGMDISCFILYLIHDLTLLSNIICIYFADWDLHIVL